MFLANYVSAEKMKKSKNGIGVSHLCNHHPSDTFIKI